MILEDFHVHTPWCDGKDTAETIVRHALELGMNRLGFSGHAHTPCDESYCMSAEKTAGYQREIEALRTEYADRITTCSPTFPPTASITLSAPPII